VALEALRGFKEFNPSLIGSLARWGSWYPPVSNTGVRTAISLVFEVEATPETVTVMR
jgi:hypothetical protein